MYPVNSGTLPRRWQRHQDAKRSHSTPIDLPPTDRHMLSILTNPLFNVVPEKKALGSDRDPMDIFDQAVARGMMNLADAVMCLKAKKLQIIQSPAWSVRQGMEESGAGRKVVKWLVSSGTSNGMEFLKDEPFMEILMEYMVAEGLQEVAWKWIKKSFDGYSNIDSLPKEERAEARRELIQPLMHLVKSEASGLVALDAAYLTLSRAAGYFEDRNLTGWLNPPGRFLIYKTTMSKQERLPPSASAFESFLSLVPAMFKDYEYQLAHLYLLHPSKPSAELALSFMEKMRRDERTGKPSTSVTTLRENRIIQLGLDTAKFLLENDQYKDAEGLMEYLQFTYPKQLGVTRMKQLEQAKAETESLQLLEGLGIA
jgi:hypothetical protein